jgi:hypothetical protein
MSCGVWENQATIAPVDDHIVSFTSVSAIEAAAASGKGRFGAELCEAWKRLSESTLWLSSWTDFPKHAKDICYSMMALCDHHS